MRELHVVALSEDGRSVLLATSRNAVRGGFRLALDDRLAAAVRGDVPRVGEDSVRASALTPKEIQSRLRAGESAAEIAREAGVAVARVERFSGPVLSERARVIDAARSAYVIRGRLGPSAQPLGAAVTAALESSSGYRPDSEEWTTRRQDDGRWVVAVSWYARARVHCESWTWDPATKQLAAVDSSAAVLGHTGTAKQPLRPGRAATSPDPTHGRAAGPVVKKGTVKQAATSPTAKAAAEKHTATAVASKPVAGKPAAGKPAAGKPAAGKRGSMPTARKSAIKKPAAKAAPRRRVVPDPPAPTPLPTRQGQKQRTSVPGWADVLLGSVPRTSQPEADR